jgi:hypothetical protein
VPAHVTPQSVSQRSYALALLVVLFLYLPFGLDVSSCNTLQSVSRVPMVLLCKVLVEVPDDSGLVALVLLVVLFLCLPFGLGASSWNTLQSVAFLFMTPSQSDAFLRWSLLSACGCAG